MSRKSRHRKNGGLGFVSVRVMAEFGSSGLWLTYTAGLFLHSGFCLDCLYGRPNRTFILRWGHVGEQEFTSAHRLVCNAL
jgi:hypothetical protein